MTRLEKIKKQIKPCKAYKFDESAKEVIQYYSENEERLNGISEDSFVNHSFMGEVLRKCEIKEKQSKAPSVYSRVLKLEIHKYAPELNRLHFVSNDGETIVFKTPAETSIEGAIKLFIQKSSVEQIKGLIRNCKVLKKNPVMA